VTEVFTPKETFNEVPFGGKKVKMKRIPFLGVLAIAMFIGVLSATAADTNAKPTKITMKGTPGKPVKNFNAILREQEGIRSRLW